MRRLRVLILSVLLLSAVSLRAQDEAPNWDFGVLPCLSYNSDLGIHYGVFADIFHYGGLYPEYRNRMYFEASRYTGGQTFLHGQFDTRYLIPGLRTTFAASYQHDPLFAFYGLCGLEPFNPQLHANPEGHTAFYYHSRTMIRVLGDVQGAITDRLNWLAGLSYWRYGLSDIVKEGYDASRTLYRQMVAGGVLAEDEATGGSRLELKAGILYDTRDLESSPSRGIHAEAYLLGSGDLSGDGYGFLRAVAHWQHYVTLLPERLVLAYHLAWQGTLTGTVPFYCMPNISTLYLRQTNTDGLGGGNTVRGLLAQRLLGDNYAWSNTELRLRLFSFDLLGQHWDIATNPFFDTGMVTRLCKSDELAEYYGETVETLRHRALRVHASAGLGLKLAMNTNFILSAEWAAPFRRTDGPSALYLNLNYIF